MDLGMDVDVERTKENTKREIYLKLAKLGDGAAGPSDVASKINSEVERLIRDGTVANDGGVGVIYWETVARGLLRCGVELAHKVGMYAVVVSLLGVGTEKMEPRPEGKQIVERVISGTISLLRQAIQDGNSSRARRAMRYLAELSNAYALSRGWLLETLQMFLEMSITDRRKSSHRRSSFLLDIAASSLPWAARGLLKSYEEDFEALVQETIDALDYTCHEEMPRYEAVFRYAHRSLCALRLQQLYNTIVDMKERKWRTGSIQHPEESPLFAERLAENGIENEPSKMQIPSHSKIMRYAAPRFRFVLEGPSTATAAGTEVDKESKKYKGVTEHFVLCELSSDILDNFRAKHMVGAGKLLTLPLPLDANLEVVEATFSDMCALPRSPQPRIYYSAVFVDLCRVQGSRLPLKLLSAVEALYAGAGRIDAEVFDRITEWFSFHLSNFGFQWNWSDWAVCGATNARDTVPFQRLFCKDVLEHASRLSYRDLIRGVIPEDLHTLLPPDPSTLMNYLEDSPTVEKVVGLITGADRRPPGELRARMMGIIEEGGDLERLRCFTAAILRAGEKTLTHFDSVTERYLSLFKELVASTGDEGRTTVLDELWRIFPVAPVRLTYILDKLCAYRILDVNSVIGYLLSDKGKETKDIIHKLEASNLWEIARLLIERQRSRYENRPHASSPTKRHPQQSTSHNFFNQREGGRGKGEIIVLLEDSLSWEPVRCPRGLDVPPDSKMGLVWACWIFFFFFFLPPGLEGFFCESRL